VNISELDVDVLPRTTRSYSADVSTTAAATADSNPYQSGLLEAMQQRLADRYAELFEVFARHHQSMGRVTLWCLEDKNSWLNNFPTAAAPTIPCCSIEKGSRSRLSPRCCGLARPFRPAAPTLRRQRADSTVASGTPFCVRIAQTLISIGNSGSQRLPR
jgi:hypothetical protein